MKDTLTVKTASDYYDPELGNTPEKELLRAVLLRAIVDSFIPHKPERVSALQWIHKKGCCVPFSFDYICVTLDLDPEDLRYRVTHLTEPVKKTRVRKVGLVYKKRAEELLENGRRSSPFQRSSLSLRNGQTKFV